MAEGAGSARLILASGSSTRRRMLEGAGLAFEVRPSTVDEAAAKFRLKAAMPTLDGGRIAEELAVLKACEVSSREPSALVLGADQTLILDGEVLSKPVDRVAARRQLAALRGRTHELVSAAVLAQSGETSWMLADRARLTMRSFSDAFLGSYLETAGERVLGSVGAYELEGLGAQFFERVEGDYFTILGLPLLPVLAELRRRGVIAT